MVGDEQPCNSDGSVNTYIHVYIYIDVRVVYAYYTYIRTYIHTICTKVLRQTMFVISYIILPWSKGLLFLPREFDTLELEVIPKML